MRQKIALFALLLLIISCSPPTIDVTKPIPPPLPPPVEQQFGTLFIDCEPPATEVFIDGLHIDGVTPLVITLLAEDHTIELQRLFYQNFKTMVTIVANESHFINTELISSLYPYTGSWRDEFPNILPDSADIVTTELNLYVLDDKIFGTDLVLINDQGRGLGNCAGAIDPANNYVELLCFYKSEIGDYWRNARYVIKPLADSRISAQSLYIDSNRRLFLGTILVRK